MWRPSCIYPAAILVLGLSAYANSLSNGFTYDDVPLVVNNPALAEGRLGDLLTGPYWPGQPEVGHYRPLTLLSFAANRFLTGTDPFGYHLVNVFLHLLNATLLFRLLARLVGNDHAAGFGALLFLLHPVHTEAVDSVVGRAELLAAFCVLTAWALYVAASESGGRRQRTLLFASVAVGFLGCLAKEQAVLLVAVLAGYDLLVLLRRRTPNPFRRSLRYDLVRTTPYLMSAGLYAILRRSATGAFLVPERPAFIDNHLAHLGGWERALSGIAATGRYVRMLVFPHPLSADYAYNAIPAVTSVWSWPLAAGLLVLAAGGLALVLALRRTWPPEVGFAVFLTGLFLLPVSNLLFPIGTRFGERLLYLPSVGFVLLASVGLRSLWTAYRRTAMGLAGAACALCLWGVATRNPDWHDNEALFGSATAAFPQNAKAQFNLGNSLRERGDVRGAMAAYGRALAVYPGYAEVHYNRGVVLQQAGEEAQAARAYVEALAADSLHVGAWVNLGTLLGRQGRMAEAAKALGRALELAPDDVNVQYNYALACQELGRAEEAVQAYQRVLDLDPGHVDAALNLGALYTDIGYTAETIAVYRRALRENPRAYRLAYNLAVLRERLGAPEQAITAYLKAAEGDDERGAYALFRAAELYRQAGEVAEAREAYARFLTRWSGDIRHRAAAERALRQLSAEQDGPEGNTE